MKANIDINFNAKKDETIPFVFHFTIHPPVVKSAFFGLFKRTPRKHILNLAVENIHIPNNTQLCAENLFSISEEDQKHSVFYDGGSDFTCDVNVLFNRLAIPAFNDISDFDVCFDVVARDDDGFVYDFESSIFAFHIEPMKPTFQAEIVLDESCVYSENEIVKIGDVVFYYPKSENCTSLLPSVNFEFLLKLKSEDGLAMPGLVWSNGTRYTDEKCLFSNIHAVENDINGYRIPVLVQPLYLDFSKTKTFKKQLNLLIVDMQFGRYWASDNADEKYKLLADSEKIIVEKNVVPTTIGIYIKNQLNEEVDITEKSCFNVAKRTFSPGSQLATVVELEIRNKANEALVPCAGLHLSAVSVSESGTQELFLRDKEGAHINNVIDYSLLSTAEERNNGSFFLPNGLGKSVVVKFQFLPSNIDYIGSNNYDFQIVTTVDFKYWENTEGLSEAKFQSSERTKSIMIMWHFYMLPHSEWLCLDYGSSAIVCKYDGNLLNLKSMKDSIVRGDAELSKFRNDDLEVGTKFLNSDIILYESQNKPEKLYSSLCSDQQNLSKKLPYCSQAVLLAPTSSLIRDRFLTQIPCLKVLVGNEMLPKDAQFEVFSYSYINSIGDVVRERARDVKDNTKSLLYINTIFSESYHTLFKYFVVSAVPDINIVNKLVLTCPNTYTPFHRSILKGIAFSVFKGLRSLLFVCESDAVAAYYMKHWHDYHTNIKKHKSPEGERVLVYDMGAGTLDITYFRQKWNASKCCHELEILGKLGTAKAGNYLDCVIADIVCSLSGIDPVIASVNVRGDGDIYSQRVLLKQVIKTQIKPRLSDSANHKISFSLQKEDGETYTVNTKDILADDRFVNCLNECSFGVVDKLKKYLGKKRPIVDTVIMSGRSCKLIPLQRKLKEAISSSSRNENPDYIALDSPINAQRVTKDDLLKTVVVDGAEIIAGEFSQPESSVKIINKRFYASFGISYINEEGEVDYAELLNHDVIADECKPDTDYITPSREIHISNNCVIQLIQSYLNEEDTLLSITDGNMEFVSLMEKFETEEMSDSHLTVSLKIDAFDNVILVINDCQSVGTAPKGMNLKDPVMKKSLWPQVFAS